MIVSPQPGELLMVLDDGVHGPELWRTDGTTAGTTLLVDLTPGPAGTSFWLLQAGSRETWFVIDRGATKDLGSTDGTAAGTRLVLTGLPFASIDAPLVELATGVLLFGADGTMWRTDRTQAGTQSLRVPAARVIEVPGWHTFLAPGTGLWRTDGTPAGTTQVLATGRAVAAALGGVLVTQGTASQTTLQLLRPSGTTQVTVPEAASVYSSSHPMLLFGQRTSWSWDGGSPAQVVRTFQSIANGGFLGLSGQRLLFAADDGISGTEPWCTDGTAGGTRLLADITPGRASTPVTFAFSGGDRGVFWASTAANGSEPWTTDGTPAGTALLADLEPGPGSSVFHDAFGGFGGVLGTRRVVVPIATSTTGVELWVSDGTASGTRLLADVQPGSGSSIRSFGYVAGAAGNTLIYAADDGQRGVEPWAVDVLGAAGWLGGACPGTPPFHATQPLLGSPWTLSARDVPAGVQGFVLLSLPPKRAFPVGNGCSVLLDPASVATLAPIQRDLQGHWSTTIPLAALPALAGVDLVAQPLFGPTSQPMGWSVGAAYWLTPGL